MEGSIEESYFSADGSLVVKAGGLLSMGMFPLKVIFMGVSKSVDPWGTNCWQVHLTQFFC